MKTINIVKNKAAWLAVVAAVLFVATTASADMATMPDSNALMKGDKTTAPMWKDKTQKPQITPKEEPTDYKSPTKGVKTKDAADLTDGKATIQEAKGEVKVWKYTKNTWLSAQPGILLEGGDRLTTGPSSYAIVRFDNKGKDIARLDEKSEMVFRLVEPTEAFLVAGHVLVKLNALAPGSSFKVGTDDAVTGVFGTTFEVIRRGDVTCVVGREGTVRVFGTGEENRATEFSQKSWWGDNKVM